MITINNLTYPILNIFGVRVPWDHPMFASILRKVPQEGRSEAMRQMSSLMREAGEKFPGLAGGEMYASVAPVTARSRAKWPLFSYNAGDFASVGYEEVNKHDSVLSMFWSIFLHDRIPEVVPRDIWDEAFDDNDEGFYEWATDDYRFDGVMIRPGEGIASLYVLNKDGENDVSFTATLHGTRLVMLGIGGAAGFVSKLIIRPEGLNEIARMRGCTVDQAYMQEDVYNILKYHYYTKVAGRTATTILHRGDTAEYAGSTYKSYTDTPLAFISKQNK